MDQEILLAELTVFSKKAEEKGSPSCHPGISLTVTSFGSGRPTRRAAVFVGVLGLAAAWCSPAAAEDAIPLPSVPAATDVVNEVLEETGVTELVTTPAAGTADPLSMLPAATAQPAAVEPVSDGAGAAPPPEPVAEKPAEAPVEAIAEPVAPTADPPPAAEALVEQTAPTNVNISVRIDSAGENGPVEQVNAALGVAEPSEAPQYQPQTPQYQAPIPDDPAPEAQTAPEPTASRPESDFSGSTWTWTWNCGSAVPQIPVGSSLTGLNWNWNWNWNCGDAEEPDGNSQQESAPQYQPVVTQYRPININISIRINSPGNDGPVVQTNVAVAVIPPILQIPVVQVPPIVSRPRVQDGSPPTAPQDGANASPELASPLQIFIGWFDPGFDPTAGLVDLGACCLVPAPRSAPYAPITVHEVLQAQHLAANKRDISAPQRFRAAVAVTMRLTKAAETAARAEKAADKPAATLRPVPSRRPNPNREPALTRDASGFAPLNAPDGRLGYLVVLVLGFAFLIAFADAARSVAAEVRAAGEDPDPPPDRPG
jgi:hypothetical protein